jgi:hypothetical protein
MLLMMGKRLSPDASQRLYNPGRFDAGGMYFGALLEITDTTGFLMVITSKT